MNPADPNVGRVELVAAALGDLLDDLVLVGGCAASLLIDAPISPPPRVTYDVDLIVEVATLHNYHALEEQFARKGFKRDIMPEIPICRWRIGEVDVDLMPTDGNLFGFSNRWYPLAVTTAGEQVLPSGTVIRLISAPVFLATKFEAYLTRGQGDPVMSHDLEDIINVVEGRLAIVEEIFADEQPVRAYLAGCFAKLLAHPDFHNVLPGLVAYDALHSQRITTVMKKIETIAAPVLP